MEAITYDLRKNASDSSPFYNKLDAVIFMFLNKVKNSSQFIIRKYAEHAGHKAEIQMNNMDEICLEFLYLGVYFKIYSSKAKKCPALWLKISRKLYNWRKKRPALKTPLDFLRSIVFRNMNAAKDFNKGRNDRILCLNSLIRWMDASGEFEGEVVRLRKWEAYLLTLNKDRADAVIARSIELADYFEILCKERLGIYTSNIDKFLERSKNQNLRKDLFLRQRKEIEYHLNLVGAEIMNRSMREEFLISKTKYILLPACMRKTETCIARKHNGEFKCAHCSPDCKVNSIIDKYRGQNFKVMVFEHTSEVAGWTNTLTKENGIGVVGVACALNLIEGGYTLKNLNVSAQCVYLDFCGCEEHWTDKAVETSLNERKLEDILKSTVETKSMHIQGASNSSSDNLTNSLVA